MTPPTSAENGSTAGFSAGDGPLRLRSAEPATRTKPTPLYPEDTPHYLPHELSTFVGREREIAELERLVGQTRLLTLTGPGGAGKTRLALAVAQDIVEEFRDGAWWVEFAPLSDPDLVPQAVAQALGVREAPGLSPAVALVEHLKARETLLILDNCEHLVDASASLVGALLRSCPGLRLLATSREALRVEGESAYLVPPLLLPDPAQPPSLRDVGRYEAVALFAERAKAANSSFELTERNVPEIVRLCRALDGMPLAIELAAARTRVLSVEQISSRLEDSLGLLTGGSRTAEPRQRTLRTAIDWSYELLSEHERALFRRLSVFAGGFVLEAAEAVCAGEGIGPEGVLDLLASLIDKSLVTVAQRGGEARYGMLEPVRQYALERLEEDAEAEETRCRHAEHYLALAETAEPQLLGADQGLWHQRLRTEFANLREAYAWSLEPGEGEGRARLRLRLAAALWRFWAAQRFEEGKVWLQTALERDSGGFPALRAKALGALGFILLFQQDYERAIAALEEAMSLYEELGDSSGAAFALGNLGWAVLHGDYRGRLPTFVREADALMQVDLDDPARAFLGIVRSSATIGQGDLDAAVPQLEESLALCRKLGDLRSASMALFILGMTELRRGNLERGAMFFKEGAGITRELGDRLGAPYFAEGLAKLATLRVSPVRAARLWGAAETLREQMGVSLSAFDLANSDYELDLASVRSALDEATFETAWAEGRAMSFEQAVDYVLDEPTSSGHEEGPRTPGVRSAVRPEDAPPDAEGTAALHVFALGRARVEREGDLIDSPDWIQKPRELLYYLLSHPEGRTKEQIGLALWPEASTSRLRSSFHDTVFRLRRALGGKEWISFRKGRYTFGGSLPYYYDVEAYERDLDEAQRLRDEAPEQAIRHLRAAADLYGGDFLEDLAPQGDWAMERQEELRRAHGGALLLLGELLVARERHAEAAEAYRKAITQDRYFEEAHRDLMRSQAYLGERGRALRHYEELAQLLEEELGSSPAPETSAFYERLRAGQEV